MKIGFMVMILKQNSNCPGGNVHLHPGQRKSPRWKTVWSKFSSAFSALTGLSIRNLTLQVKPSVWSYTVMYLGRVGRTWGRSGRTKCTWIRGCSIMTMHQHTSLWLCSSFWLPNTWQSSPTPSITNLSPLWLLPLPKMKIKLKGQRCWHKGLPGQLPIVAETLWSFRMLPRCLLWRGWWRLGLWMFYLFYWYVLWTSAAPHGYLYRVVMDE